MESHDFFSCIVYFDDGSKKKYQLQQKHIDNLRNTPIVIKVEVKDPLECAVCENKPTHYCKDAPDQHYCDLHAKSCCRILRKFPLPKPKYSWEGKVN